MSRDPIESEPPYQYVRGNPANYIDPSGLLKNYIIARELGFNNFDEVMEAFAADGDWELLKALQDAANSDKIYIYAGIIPPTKAGYSERGSLVGSWNLLGEVTCVDGKLKINWDQNILFSKSRFRSLLYRAFSINKKPVRWDSQRVAYTNINTGGHRSWGFIGADAQVGLPLKVISFGGDYIIDRYGRRYAGPAASLGLSPIPGEVQVLAGVYPGDWSSFFNAAVYGQGHPIPISDQLAGYLSGWSIRPVSGVVFLLGGTVPMNGSGASGVITLGLNVGLEYAGGSWMFPIDTSPREEHAWDWADRMAGFDRSSILRDDNEETPTHDCSECTGRYFDGPVNIPPVLPPK